METPKIVFHVYLKYLKKKQYLFKVSLVKLTLFKEFNKLHLKWDSNPQPSVFRSPDRRQTLYPLSYRDI
jgi:hypothetical protein